MMKNLLAPSSGFEILTYKAIPELHKILATAKNIKKKNYALLLIDPKESSQNEAIIFESDKSLGYTFDYDKDLDAFAVMLNDEKTETKSLIWIEKNKNGIYQEKVLEKDVENYCFISKHKKIAVLKEEGEDNASLVLIDPDAPSTSKTLFESTVISTFNYIPELDKIIAVAENKDEDYSLFSIDLQKKEETFAIFEGEFLKDNFYFAPKLNVIFSIINAGNPSLISLDPKKKQQKETVVLKGELVKHTFQFVPELNSILAVQRKNNKDLLISIDPKKQRKPIVLLEDKTDPNNNNFNFQFIPKRNSILAVKRNKKGHSLIEIHLTSEKSKQEELYHMPNGIIESFLFIPSLNKIVLTTQDPLKYSKEIELFDLKDKRIKTLKTPLYSNLLYPILAIDDVIVYGDYQKKALFKVNPFIKNYAELSIEQLELLYSLDKEKKEKKDFKKIIKENKELFDSLPKIMHWHF